MRVLALDLGTKTGWALADNELSRSGTWTLVPESIRKQNILGGRPDARFRALKDLIAGMNPLDAIFYEDVQFCKTQYQAQLWGGLRAIVTLFEKHGVLSPITAVQGVPVGTLKKFASGRGNATKKMMAQALYDFDSKTFEGGSEKQVKRGVFLCRRGTDIDVDDNEVDALHLLRYGLKQLNQPCKIRPQ